MNNISIYIYFCFCCICFLASVFASLSKNKEIQDAYSGFVSQKSLESTNYLIIKQSQGNTLKNKSYFALSGLLNQIFLSSEVDGIEKLARQLAAADKDVLSSIAEDFSDVIHSKPEHAVHFLDELCHEIALENPGNALEFAGSFFYLTGVPSIERSILGQWNEDQPGKIFQDFEKSGSSVNSHHLSIVASLMQQEQQERLPEFLNWVENLYDIEGRDEEDQSERLLLFGEAVNKLTTHVNDDTLNALTGFLERHVDSPLAAANLAQISSRYLVRNPEKGFQWLHDLDIKDNATRSMIFGSAIEGLAKTHPKDVANFLSGEDFIEKYYIPESPDESPEQTQVNQEIFFDDMLENYITATILEDPELAHRNAEAFFNQERRSDAQDWANELREPISAQVEGD